jgi:hypothetical protein
MEMTPEIKLQIATLVITVLGWVVTGVIQKRILDKQIASTLELDKRKYVLPRKIDR